MNAKIVWLLLASFLLATLGSAQKPVWQGKGRIAMSSDGNEHDHDDWAATPLSLALLAAEGLQNKFVLYTYSDHIWGSNHEHPTSKSGLNAYQQMEESALGGKKWFGFDRTNFICAVDDAEKAYNAMRDEINGSTQKNPLIIIAAGPMQVVGEAISRADVRKRQFVTVISHSKWNNEHANKPSNWENHSGWTFKAIQDSFCNARGGSLKCIQILDQNKGADYVGLNADLKLYDWIKTSSARNHKLYKPGAWDWLYSREETCIKGKGTTFDPSDAGMVIYMLTGVDKTNPAMAQQIMEHPKKKRK